MTCDSACKLPVCHCFIVPIYVVQERYRSLERDFEAELLNPASRICPVCITSLQHPGDVKYACRPGVAGLNACTSIELILPSLSYRLKMNERAATLYACSGSLSHCIPRTTHYRQHTCTPYRPRACRAGAAAGQARGRECRAHCGSGSCAGMDGAEGSKAIHPHALLSTKQFHRVTSPCCCCRPRQLLLARKGPCGSGGLSVCGSSRWTTRCMELTRAWYGPVLVVPHFFTLRA